MPRRKTPADYHALAESRGFHWLGPEVTDSKTSTGWECEHGHQWQATFNNIYCNTIECTWSWLRQMVRTYRGVSKVYLLLYVAQFEFLHNRRHQNHWSRTLDVLRVLLLMDANRAADLLGQVMTAEFAELCPVAG